jgi:RNA polymerase sigma factor (sigma-70 family)
MPSNDDCRRTPANGADSSARNESMLETRVSLLERVREQFDSAAWHEFVTLYRPLLLGYIQSRGLSLADADDVVQDIFISLLRSLSTFSLDKKRGRFRSWLWQVAMNAVRDQARRRTSRKRAEDRKRELLPVAVEPSEPDPELIRRHRERILELVLPRIKADTQELTWTCFEEHILKGRSGKEVGAELDMKPNTVCVNAARVLKRVREHCETVYLEDLGDDDTLLG